VFGAVSRMLCDGLGKDATIAYAATGFSEPLKKLLSMLQVEVPESTLYIVCPKSAAEKLGLDTMLVLDGTFEDIPIKDDYLDLLVVTGNIRSDRLETCLTEWHRVVGQDGSLALVTPTAVIASYEEPLGIGEFIEKREHPPPENDENFSGELLTQHMSKYFERVEQKQVVHITILQGFHPRTRSR